VTAAIGKTVNSEGELRVIAPGQGYTIPARSGDLGKPDGTLSSPCFAIINSYFGSVSEGRHVAGAAASRPLVPIVTDVMFARCEAKLRFGRSCRM